MLKFLSKAVVFVVVASLIASSAVMALLKVGYYEMNGEPFWNAIARQVESTDKVLHICKKKEVDLGSECQGYSIVDGSDIKDNFLCTFGHISINNKTLRYITGYINVDFITFLEKRNLDSIFQYLPDIDYKKEKNRSLVGNLEARSAQRFRDMEYNILQTKACNGFFIHNVRVK